MLSIEPTRREFLQTAAVAVGALMLPIGLRASEDQRFWFLQTGTGETKSSLMTAWHRPEIRPVTLGTALSQVTSRGQP